MLENRSEWNIHQTNRQASIVLNLIDISIYTTNTDFVVLHTQICLVVVFNLFHIANGFNVEQQRSVYMNRVECKSMYTYNL